ncbi:hypothetical protein HDU97_004013 [Phlyctochytrium planicorne]|nr:hypothetical protein HDU97_004013 [Phlyctochytrium planicorne]
MASVIVKSAPLNIRAPFETDSPFLFTVYHKDDYPNGNDKMEAPRIGNGNDFNPTAPYRIFETVTCVVEGTIDHTDSLGAAGRYSGGDLQWLTTGKGIVHGEMFPLVNKSSPNPLKLYQIWLNLPAKSKMCEPAQVMFWRENIGNYVSPDKKANVTVWAGDFYNVKGQRPPKDSWAAKPENDVAVWRLVIQPQGKITLPKSLQGTTRNAFFLGETQIKIGGTAFQDSTKITLRDNVEAEIENVGAKPAEILVLQGKPINEPIRQHGPFVMNTDDEIRQAFRDYQQTRFGGWPWPEDAMVFPRTKGRFVSVNGKEELPPS